jgi:hypothetical protein
MIAAIGGCDPNFMLVFILLGSMLETTTGHSLATQATPTNTINGPELFQ